MNAALIENASPDCVIYLEDVWNLISKPNECMLSADSEAEILLVKLGFSAELAKESVCKHPGDKIKAMEYAAGVKKMKNSVI